MISNAEINADEFWKFSLAFYDTDDVSRRLIDLQDTEGANVNLLLFQCFLIKKELLLSQSAVIELQASLNELDRQTRAVREKRRALKQVSESKYKEALAKELELEKRQQQALVTCFLEHAPIGSCTNPLWIELPFGPAPTDFSPKNLDSPPNFLWITANSKDIHTQKTTIAETLMYSLTDESKEKNPMVKQELNRLLGVLHDS